MAVLTLYVMEYPPSTTTLWRVMKSDAGADLSVHQFLVKTELDFLMLISLGGT